MKERIFIEDFRTGETLKRCSKCFQYKKFTEYHKCSKPGCGIVPRCKACCKQQKYKDDVDRFWKYYHSHTKKVGDCVEWTARYGTRDRPILRTWRGKDCVQTRRVVYGLSSGELPDEMFVITICGNTRCVRQSHLKAITSQEMEAIRCNAPAKSRAVKLSEPIVRDVRTRIASGESKKSIAKSLNVSYPTILRVGSGKTWAHVE